MADVEPAHPDLPSFDAKIKALEDLKALLKKLREVPIHLASSPLRAAGESVMTPQGPALFTKPLTVKERVRAGWQDLHALRAQVASAAVQDALDAAAKSEDKDKSGLLLLKRKRSTDRVQPQAESPRPYVSFRPQAATSLFPDAQDASASVRLDGLLESMRDYNRRREDVNVHILSPGPRQQFVCPVVLRFLIRDVVSFFLTLDLGENRQLIVENVSAFGPREQKLHSTQSDFLAYQKLSQQITKMVQSQPQVPLRIVWDLLASYDTLFTRQCAACRRILSPETHVPPVARAWVGKRADDTPGWEPRHPTCMQR